MAPAAKWQRFPRWQLLAGALRFGRLAARLRLRCCARVAVVAALQFVRGGRSTTGQPVQVRPLQRQELAGWQQR
ncbi:MAG: hypothetical protein DWI67_06285 [Chloroflexi bacterium]|nr:MAG: hypothetical protein DWI67_06285 [Chloroflexota bacterium]